MSFEEEVKNFTDTELKTIKNIDNEKETITKLIQPFLKILGYSKVKEDYPVEINQAAGKKFIGKIDIVILDNNEPEIIIECKYVEEKLNKKHRKQLETYYNNTPNCKIGILTNGIIYKFFTSTNKGMDKEPFIEVDLTNLSNEDITKLEIFKKGNYNPNTITEIAKDIKYNTKIKKI